MLFLNSLVNYCTMHSTGSSPIPEENELVIELNSCKQNVLFSVHKTLSYSTCRFVLIMMIDNISQHTVTALQHGTMAVGSASLQIRRSCQCLWNIA